MAGELGTISGQIVIEYDNKGIAKAERDAQGFKKSSEDAGSKASASFKKINRAAVVASAAVVAGAIAMGKQLYTLGVDLTKMDQKAEAVFEGELPRVRKWAEANHVAMGLTSTGAVNAAASLADLLKPMGFTTKQATDMSTRILDLSGALANWSGGTKTAAEVSDILAKAMLGEREGLKSLGISITETDIQTRLATKGQEGLTGAALAQAKAVATQELVFEKSTDAQTAWANGGREAAEAANAGAVSVQELKESFARGLAPALQSIMKLLAAVAGFFEKHRTLSKVLVGAVLALATAILAANAAYKVYTTWVKAAELAQLAFRRSAKLTNAAIGAQRLALAAARFGPWVAAIVAAGAALGLFGKKQKEFSGAAEDFGSTLDDQTGAITENTRAMIANNLEKDGALEAARKLGIDTKLLVDAVTGETGAFEELEKQFQNTDSAFSTLGLTQDEFLAAQRDLGGSIALNREELDKAQGSWQRQTEAIGGTVEATEAAAEATAEHVQEIADAAIKYGESIGEMAGANAAMEAANAGLREDQKLTTQAFLEEFERRVKIAQDHNTNIVKIQNRASSDVRDQMLADAKENPELAALMVGATDKEWRRMEDLYRQATRAATTASSDELIRSVPALSKIAGTAGQEAARKLADKIRGGGKLTVHEVRTIMGKAKNVVEGTELLAVIDSALDDRSRAAAERQLAYLARPRIAHINAQITQTRGVNAPQAYQRGGVVPGPRTRAVPIVAHGTERVLSPDQTKAFHRMLIALGSTARRARTRTGQLEIGGTRSNGNVTTTNSSATYYTVAPGAVQVDASKLRSFDDVVSLLGDLKSTSRQFYRRN